MNLNSVTELNLLTALRTLGALQSHPGQVITDPSTVSAAPTGAVNAPTTVESDGIQSSVAQLSRDELLRLTQHLVDGLLRVQIRAPTAAPSYLSVVFPCLFRLINNEHQDVRIAADEGINKLIKFLRVSMTHQVICELFLELKRDQNPRSVTAALSKFAMLTPRIRPSKRRFYTANLLPVLVTVCQREDEAVFEALTEHFPQIATQLFYYASERELRAFLRQQTARLSSETASIRRAIAQLLVLTCQHSRFPIALLRSLLQHVLVELGVSNETVSPQHRAGLFNTLRYLSIAWEQVLVANPNGLLSEIPPNFRGSAVDSSGLERPSSGSKQSSDGSGRVLQSGDQSQWASYLVTKEAELTELEQHLWSYAFFTCLDFATSTGAITVCTAALEALLQLIQSGRPMRLYPRRWLTNDTDWLTLPTSGTAVGGVPNPPMTSSSSYEPSMVDDSEYSQAQYVDRNGLLRRLSRTSLDTELANDQLTTEEQDEEETDRQQQQQSLVRSLSSSNSLTSSLDVDTELTAAQQEVRKQLSIVRARLAQKGEHHDPDAIATNGRSVSDYPGAVDVDYAMIPSIGLPSESSDLVDVANDATLERDWTEPGCTVKLLTLRKLLSQLVTIDRLDDRLEDPWSMARSDWIVPYLVLHFCLLPTIPDLPRPDQLPRTSSQLLAIACLSQLTRLCPRAFVTPLDLNRCCSLESSIPAYPTVVDLILDLLEFHSDPQLRGQLCLLAGHVITSYLVGQSLARGDIDADQWPAWSDVHPLLERLLTGVDNVLSTETSGTTVRLAVASLSVCANAILTCVPGNADKPGQTTLAHKLLQCVARHAVPLARHSYRLVRREFLVFASELDWHAIVFLEQQCAQESQRLTLTRPTRLIDVAWVECWRLLSDPDSELRAVAANTLLSLSAVLTAGGDTFSTPKHARLLHRCLERRLHYWYPKIYSSTRLPVSSFGLTDCWTQHSFPPCLSDVPAELDVGPASVQHHLRSPPATRLLYFESINSPKSLDAPYQQPALGTLRLFRECVSALIELPCPSLLPENRYMLHGVARCLNRLFGQTHILANSHVWYSDCDQQDTEALDPTGLEDSPPRLLARQRRPRIALVSWQCLSLLSATAVTTTDLELHAELVSLTTGCLLRWAVHAMTEGSIPTGAAAMSLDLQHAYTRFALSYLHHVARMLFLLWHVVDEVQPAPAPTAALIADPFHPDAPIGILNSISLMAQTGVNAVAQATQAAANKAVQGAAAAATTNVVVAASGGKKGLRLNTSFRKQPSTEPKTSTPSDSRPTPGNRRLLGYFSHLPHYMALYRTVKAAFQTFKISPDPSGSHDRFMGLLCVYLRALSRLMTSLRLAETAPYSDELLTYVAKLYHWQPGLCLDAASQILRAFVGTNLISHWDNHLARLYNLALGGCVTPANEPTQSNEEDTREPDGDGPANGLHDLLDRLLKRHNHRIDLLLRADGTESVSTIATWSSSLHHLRRAPITAWIRFARQWRVPLPLTSKASAIKSELTEFFKRFEHIVIQSMEIYRWTTCSELQSGILNLLTHLICLRLNYEQLDTDQHFLKAVMNHCQNLSLEVQRLHLLGTLKAGPYGTRRGPEEAFGIPSFPMDGFPQQQQRLVHAIFRFLVSLSYHQQKSKPSTAEGPAPSSPDKAENTSASHQKLVEFSQVMHMAETLAAEGLDPGSVVLSSLVPIVADLYVIQRLPVVTTQSKDTVSAAAPCSLEQAEVQREAVLGFVLRRLTHLPASYDQLCLILEEASLVPDSTADEIPPDGSRLERVLESIFQAILAHMNAGTALMDSRTDLDALLRLFDHLLLALTSRDSLNKDVCCQIIRRLNQVITAAAQSPPLFVAHSNSIGFRRWAVAQVACARLLLNLARLLNRDTTLHSSPARTVTDMNGTVSTCPGYGQRLYTTDSLDMLQFMDFPLRIFHCILAAVHQQLTSSPHLATSLLMLSGLDDSGSSSSLGLLMQLLLLQLLTLIDLMESDSYRTVLFTQNVWHLREGASLDSSNGTSLSAVAVDIEAITGLVLSIGQFEPLVPTLWFRVMVQLRQSASSQPDMTTCLSGCPVDSDLLSAETVSHAFLLVQLQRALKQGDKPSTIFNRLFIGAGGGGGGGSATAVNEPARPQYARLFKRLLAMWQVGEAPVREWFLQIAQCPSTSRLLLDRCAHVIPQLSLSELRTLLHVLTQGLHPATTGQQLALLWDHFIAPRNLHASNAGCTSCHRNTLPLGLRHQASRGACTLLRRLIKASEQNNSNSNNVAGGLVTQSVLPVPLAVLMDYCARLPKNARTLPATIELGELLDRLINTITPAESCSGRHNSEAAQVVLDVASVVKQIEQGQSDWLLDAVQSLLSPPCSATGVRMAARLMQLLVSLNLKRIDERIGYVLRNTCPRCCPRLLQYALTLEPALACPSPGHPVKVVLDTQSATIIPQMNTLFQMAVICQDLLFERMQQIINNPYRLLIEQAAERTLIDSLHSQLTGLCTALVHYLRLVPHLPAAADAIPIEGENLALNFLCILVEFALYTMGCPLSQVPHMKPGSNGKLVDSSDRRLPAACPCSPSFLHSLLDLMDDLLQTVSCRFLKGVDVLGDDADRVLTLFVTFLAAIDRATSISEPLTHWTDITHHLGGEAPDCSQPSVVPALLSPAYPSLFGSWYPDPVPAALVSSFTALSATCAAATVLSGTTDLGPSECTEPQGFIQPCQLLNRCRLLRSSIALTNGSALASKINVCLIGCVRLLNIRTARKSAVAAATAAATPVPDDVVTRSGVRASELNFNLQLHPDPELLLTQIARITGCGWLDRRQFEQMWMAFLELLAGSDEDELAHEPGGPPPELSGAEAELIERNQCMVLGLHGLTRLLLDVSLRPQPGDPIHSQLIHQPRLSTPHFSHTKLGRKLTALTSLIEQERLRLHLPQGGTCPTSAIASTPTGTMEPSSAGSHAWFGPLINSEVSAHAAELRNNTVESNLERLADAPDNLPGPSQFAVHWLVRRLMPPTEEEVAALETEEEPVTISFVGETSRTSSSPVLTPRPRRTIPVVHSIADYEDLLFSCLQSIQLLYQSWARVAPDGPGTSDLGGGDITRPTLGTDRETTMSSATDPASKISAASLGDSSWVVTSGPVTQPKGLVLAALQSVVRSAVILSDLFTSREQFVWLMRYLQDIVDKLPTPKQFPAPIHIWLTLGLARCAAVLELARSGPHSEPLHEATLEPVVRHTLAMLQTNVTVLQDIGLQGAMLLLHAALLIRAQPHQRQTQQHSPPTGSPSLNELYSKVCLYLEQKLVALFSPPSPLAGPIQSSSYTDGTGGEGSRLSATLPRWIPTPLSESARPGAGSTGFKRFVSGVFGGSGGYKDVPPSGSMATATATASSTATATATPSSVTLVSRVERHQLTVLAAAFFLAEHFSAPPIYPVLTDFGSGLTEMLSGLTSNLFRLAHPMLSDVGASITTAGSTQLGSTVSASVRYLTLGAGTTSDLCYSPAVHTAWCRGTERLVLMGRLGKGATESLQKLCVMRLRSCRSPHLSLPVLRLLVTCMYANAGRLNTQLQHYRRVPLAPDYSSKIENEKKQEEQEEALSNSSDGATVATSNNNVKTVGPSDQQDTSIVVLPLSVSLSDNAVLPPSLLMDSEATAGMTQEFLSCLWERLRGGVAPIVHAHTEPIWLTSAWTSVAEASVVARILPATSTDIIQSIAGLLVHGSPQSRGQSGWDTVIEGHVEDPVLNKALGEFARLDHAHPDLAAQTLAQLFGRFMDRPGGQALIRQWVILSLPTLLSRQPQRLAIWATTVCLLAASTEPTLRAALCLCSTQVAFSITNTPTVAPPNVERSANQDATAGEETSPLLSDLLCLAAVHFVRSGLLSRRDSDAARVEQRQTFLSMFRPEPGDEQQLRFSLGPNDVPSATDRDRHTLRRVYALLQREMSGEM